MSFGFGFSLPAYAGYAASFGPSSFGSGTSLALDFLNGNNTLDPRITFSRTSNATLTNSAGVLTYAPHNLLTFSEQFDNSAWTKNASATVTANSGVAPDGTTTADQLQGSLVNTGVWRVPTVTPSLPHVYSLYVKNVSNATALRIGCDANPANAFVSFNAVTGTITSAAENVTSSSVVDVGSGWYRVVIGFTPTTSAPSFIIYSTTGSDATWQLWGAQLNVGALQPYYPTTVKNLLGYTQEFDNAAWTKSNSFVQTNLLTYSQDFDNAAWGKLTSTVSVNQAVAPDGTTTADKFVANNSTSGYIEQSAAYVAGNIYVWSFYAKAAERDTVSFLVYGTNFGGTNLGRTYTLTGAGSVGALSGTSAPPGSSIVSVGDGWYRCTFTAVCATSHTAASFQIRDGVNGTGSAGRFIWGAQLVQGSTAGDYQVTYGTAAAVGYTAPDGSVTADKLVENTAASTGHFVTTSTTFSATQVVTFSAYAKAAERSFFQLVVTGVGPAGLNVVAGFDLALGTAGAPNYGTSSVDAVGNGWFRCSYTIPIATGTLATLQARLALNSAGVVSSYTGDGTSGIYIWGAQLSDSASLDPYVYNPVAAPASTAYYGPRFDYDPVTLAPRGLLIEEQRTNLLLRSEEFNNDAWTKTATTVTANAVISPDGTQDADVIRADATNAEHVCDQTFTAATGTTYTFSAYVKANGLTDVGLRSTVASLWTGGVSPQVRFNLTSGTASTISGTPSASSIQSLGNGWYRVSMSVACVANGTPSARIQLMSGVSNVFTGNGTDGITTWGAQVEAGAFATSYIPTTTAAATRAADVATMIGANFSNWYNQSEGTVYSEISSAAPTVSGAARRIANINNGTESNRIVTAWAGSTGVSAAFVTDAGVAQAAFNSPSGAYPIPTKVALAYKVNDFNASVNGVAFAADTSGTVPVVDRMVLGDVVTGGTGPQNLNGTIKRIAYYPRRLANTELQSITA